MVKNLNPSNYSTPISPGIAQNLINGKGLNQQREKLFNVVCGHLRSRSYTARDAKVLVEGMH